MPRNAELSFSKLGKDILNLAHSIIRESPERNRSYVLVLYAAYFIDRGEVART